MSDHYTMNIGSISHGTLRTQDLLTACADEIDKILDTDSGETTYTARLSVMTIRDSARGCAAALEARDDHDETPAIDDLDSIADETLQECYELLSECTPAYCYFGAHAGDGSDLGCWPDMGQIEADLESGELAKISDPNELDSLPTDCCGAVHVSDHGNLALYLPRRTWAAHLEPV